MPLKFMYKSPLVMPLEFMYM